MFLIGVHRKAARESESMRFIFNVSPNTHGQRGLGHKE